MNNKANWLTKEIFKLTENSRMERLQRVRFKPFSLTFLIKNTLRKHFSNTLSLVKYMHITINFYILQIECPFHSHYNINVIHNQWKIKCVTSLTSIHR